MQKKFELDKILKLAEQRELLTTQLSSFELPEIIIPNERNEPLYKITISMLGDFLIFINRNSIRSVYGMLSQISNPDSIVDGMDFEVAMTYLEAANYLSGKKSKFPPVPRPNKASNRRSSVMDDITESLLNNESWALIFALPAVKCLDLVDLLYKIFGDDLHSYKE